MNNQILIIYKFRFLYEIIKELEPQLNLKVYEVQDQKNLKNKLQNFDSCLVLLKKKIDEPCNQLILNQIPIRFYKLIEKINIQHLKIKFNQKSELKISKYLLDLNSRELKKDDVKLKLTEKETNIIVHLSKSLVPVRIDKLQLDVWGYHSELETHTVETHIYRLRKKILNFFNDDNFIVSKKEGYFIE